MLCAPFVDLFRELRRQDRDDRDDCENHKKFADELHQYGRDIHHFLIRFRKQRCDAHRSHSFVTNTANGGQPVRFGKLHCNTV